MTAQNSSGVASFLGLALLGVGVGVSFYARGCLRAGLRVGADGVIVANPLSRRVVACPRSKDSALAFNQSQAAALEDAARDVARAEQELADAKQKRNELVVRTLQELGDRHGALAAVARSAGVTLEAARQLRPGSWR